MLTNTFVDFSLNYTLEASFCSSALLRTEAENWFHLKVGHGQPNYQTFGPLANLKVEICVDSEASFKNASKFYDVYSGGYINIIGARIPA